MKRIMVVAMGATALVLAGCGSLPHHHAAARTAMPAAQQPQPSPPPAQPPAESAWEENSPGYQSWLDAGSDMHTLGRYLDAGDFPAIIGSGGEGFKLAEAAAAALQNPSPVDRHEYKKAMANFGFMGMALTNNNFKDAKSFAKKALKAMRAWATAAQPGASGAQLCGIWNLPQSSNC